MAGLGLRYLARKGEHDREIAIDQLPREGYLAPKKPTPKVGLVAHENAQFAKILAGAQLLVSSGASYSFSIAAARWDVLIPGTKGINSTRPPCCSTKSPPITASLA